MMKISGSHPEGASLIKRQKINPLKCKIIQQRSSAKAVKRRKFKTCCENSGYVH